jgi:AraC-like DNA-binding protein
MGSRQDARAAALDRLDHAREIIDHDLETGGSISMAEVADRTGCSPSHFARTFRQVHGESPGRYRARRRVERAKELLADTDLSVQEICARVGYRSIGSFTTLFARVVGEPPTRYRDRVNRCPTR